jgi:hypothetical protein
MLASECRRQRYKEESTRAKNLHSKRETEDTYPYEDRTITNPNTQLDSLKTPAQPSQPAMEIIHGTCIFGSAQVAFRTKGWLKMLGPWFASHVHASGLVYHAYGVNGMRYSCHRFVK